MGLVLGVCAPSLPLLGAPRWGGPLLLGLAWLLSWGGSLPCCSVVALACCGRGVGCLGACLRARSPCSPPPALPWSLLLGRAPPRAPLLSCRRLLLLCRWHSCTVPSFAGGVGAVAWHSSDPTPHRSLAAEPRLLSCVACCCDGSILLSSFAVPFVAPSVMFVATYACNMWQHLSRWHSPCAAVAGGVGAVAWPSSDPPHSLAELPLVTFECAYIHFHRYWPLPPCCRAGLALLRPPGPCLPPWPLWVLAASLALPCSAPALLALLVGLWRGSALLSGAQPTHAPVHPLAVLLQNRPEVQSPAYIPLWGWPST